MRKVVHVSKSFLLHFKELLETVWLIFKTLPTSFRLDSGQFLVNQGRESSNFPKTRPQFSICGTWRRLA